METSDPRGKSYESPPPITSGYERSSSLLVISNARETCRTRKSRFITANCHVGARLNRGVIICRDYTTTSVSGQQPIITCMRGAQHFLEGNDLCFTFARRKCCPPLRHCHPLHHTRSTDSEILMGLVVFSRESILLVTSAGLICTRLCSHRFRRQGESVHV